MLLGGEYKSSFTDELLDSVYKNGQNFQYLLQSITLANIYLFKFSNRNNRKRCQIRSRLTIKTPEQRHLGNFDMDIFETSPHPHQ